MPTQSGEYARIRPFFIVLGLLPATKSKNSALKGRAIMTFRD